MILSIRNTFSMPCLRKNHCQAIPNQYIFMHYNFYRILT